MQKRKLSLNTLFSLLLELTTVVCGLILPRLLIRSYGSDVNGLVNSIKQFLSAISFLEFGIGAVIKSALYKPLAESNSDGINKIISSASKFFRKIGLILLIYISLLMVVYPAIMQSGFSKTYISVLIIALSINSFVQYFVGCVDGILLYSAQQGYIQAATQIIAITINTIACSILINAGFGIHVVQFATAFIYLIRPIIVRKYVKQHYLIDYHTKYVGEPITQKWYGVAQHIASMILESTDIIVLTWFSSLSSVSVYSVYFFVIRGIKQVFSSMSEGFQALLGELFAKDDMGGMEKAFDFMEWAYGTLTTFVYGCSMFLILPFVSVYTLKISDTNYQQPFFAVIIVSAFWIFSNNAPYHTAILAAGHYRQTQHYFIIAAVINIVISVTVVRMYGLIGVAVGTLAAMIFQSSWMIIYNVRHISKRPVKKIIKQFSVDGIIILISSFLSSFIRFTTVSWSGWIVMGVKIALIWGVVLLLTNYVFYRDMFFSILPKWGRRT